MSEEVIELPYFKDKKVLIVESIENTRVAYETAFKSIGVNRKCLKFVKSIKLALAAIDDDRPNIIFTYESLNNENFNELLKVHLKLYPNRIDNSFVVLTQNYSIDAISKIAQAKVDNVLTLPFTVESIKGILNDINDMKGAPTEYRSLINEIYEYIGKDNTKATELITKAKDLSDRPYEAYFLESVCLHKDQRHDESLSILSKAYALNQKNFNTLKLFFQVHKEKAEYKRALKYARELYEHFPTSPAMIKDLAMVSVAAQEHKLILNYYAEYKKIVEPDVELKDAIAAALVIYAKCELQDEELKKLGRKALSGNKRFQATLKILEEAAVICTTKPYILDRIVTLLSSAPEIKNFKVHSDTTTRKISGLCASNVNERLNSGQRVNCSTISKDCNRHS